MPGEEHVARLIAFAGGWDRGAPMVVHCFAGISRSTAAAYVAACALNPQRDEAAHRLGIRRASRTAQPNARIVSLADRLLKRDGRMVARDRDHRARRRSPAKAVLSGSISTDPAGLPGYLTPPRHPLTWRAS